MRITFILIFIISTSLPALSQDFEYNKPTNSEWEMKNYNNDTSVHAVVLREYGKAHISVADNLPVIFEYHVRIKILDDKGFESGKVMVSLYQADKDRNDNIRFIKGVTMYRDENGTMKKVAFNTDNAQRTKANLHYDDVKFTLPALQPGCIIEYSYEIEQPYRDKFHTWEFQSDIPKLHSEYVAVIPGIYEYKVSLRGSLQLSGKKITQQPQSFAIGDFTADCTTINYTMDNIPPFIEEEYMTSSANYKSALHFEILATTTGDNFMQKLTKEWKDIDYGLKYHENFGGQINHTGFMKRHLPANMLNITDTVERAKAIYSYLQKTLKWNGFNSIFSHDGIEKTIDTNTGNSADINLALIAALRAAGINMEAVLLSTRGNGLVNKLYPVLTGFNYMIAKANIAGKSYLLDATDQMLSFGMLPLRCINDQGRVISMDKPSYWIDMVQPVKRNTATTITLAMQADGKIKGTYTNYDIGYAAYEARVAINGNNGTGDYVKSFFDKYSNVKVLKWSIDGIDSLDIALTENYEFEIATQKDADGNILFDPTLFVHLKENPFKLPTRNYPVDMGAALKANLSLILTYPSDYTVVSQPHPIQIALPNNGGNFITTLNIESGIIKYAQVKQLNKAIYTPNEYPWLKEYYDKILLSQKTPIVFKKKS